LIRILQILCAFAFLAALGLFCALALAPPGTDLGVFANRADDKAGHFAVFFLLGPLAAAALPGVRIAWTALALLFLSAATEYGQTFTGREASLDDFAANVLGLMAGMFPLAACRLRLALRHAARDAAGGAGGQ